MQQLLEAGPTAHVIHCEAALLRALVILMVLVYTHTWSPAQSPSRGVQLRQIGMVKSRQVYAVTMASMCSALLGAPVMTPAERTNFERRRSYCIPGCTQDSDPSTNLPAQTAPLKLQHRLPRYRCHPGPSRRRRHLVWGSRRPPPPTHYPCCMRCFFWGGGGGGLITYRQPRTVASECP